MSRAYNNLEFIDNSEMESNLPKTFSAIVNNDDILQMYLREIGNAEQGRRNGTWKEDSRRHAKRKGGG